MILGNSLTTRVFVYQAPIDMRCGFEKLSHFVRDDFGDNLLEGHIYLFLGKNRKRAKVLVFDKTGLLLLTKRLENGKIVPLRLLTGVNEINMETLAMVLSGAHVQLPR